MADRPRRDRHTAHPTGSDLPADVIDELDAITAGLRRMDDQLGGGNLQTLVGAHLRTVVDLLEHRRYTTLTGRRLHTTAAELLPAFRSWGDCLVRGLWC
ncbi:MAG: hypothetical protein HYR62_03345 [Actinobacteria bacterium]|nr:hypothetical protein [Actinomycetota bacterium]